MSSLVVIGSQWGDEGKGKIVDYLASRADIVARFQGGANAGHTVVVEGTQFILHQIPSGIIFPQPECVIGNGVVIDPAGFIEERENLNKRGIKTAGRIKISGKAHMLLSYHKVMDQEREASRGKGKIGTTGRGIGPAYEDKIARNGVRVMDFHNPDKLRAKILENAGLNNKILQAIGSQVVLDGQAIAEEVLSYRDTFLELETDVSLFLYEGLARGKKLLIEGAQGLMLDVDHGTYPYVTSSNTSIGGAFAGLGLGPKAIEIVLGVIKAYTTRVGNGPLPTELKNKEGEKLRELGAEYGATTGRPRRCGWFDAVVTRYSKRINGLTGLAVTKLDVLDTLDEIKICNAYQWRGKTLTEFPFDPDVLEQCEPVYEVHKGWKTETSGITDYDSLPAAARKYLARISEIMDCPIRLVSVGVQRDQIINCGTDF
ncbi:MAG: adenylosuccinate synthase [Candidatus Glassbacteria bacterium RIFCSPLOWO2_12_FULL_58_11]|uniref:Adenylosuccinate synthetase n=2 Tax=Candidatus Glassiibacteriota TaxID=1817805 RepID=A0A1F5YQ81_9BACT|nr:MAG: adenylosuccinate synthase [Candidatus Glassbacteria bacterium GWA2_58_10]OGG02360.1 MAG: adenylosuccinate synthase [Candidatus Glassbacteria bacterium RIFCSPLOWO2_12_FULL_58_11]